MVEETAIAAGELAPLLLGLLADPGKLTALGEAMRRMAAVVELARQLGFNGTPSWVAGDALLSGAVGKERLQAAITDSQS